MYCTVYCTVYPILYSTVLYGLYSTILYSPYSNLCPVYCIFCIHLKYKVSSEANLALFSSPGPPGFGYRTCMAYNDDGHKTRLNR